VSAVSPRFRSVLDKFAPYRPGKESATSDGRSYKLSSNESPYGPLPSVLKVIAEAAGSINRYPDNGAADLTEAIAGRYGVPASHVAVGCGSVGVAQQLLEAVAEPGAEVMYAWRSFEAYPYLSDLASATSVRVPLRDEALDLPAMAAAVTERTRLIFVCTPNNPTGTVVHRHELEEFMGRVPQDCLVVLDEAYSEYVRDPEAPDGMTLYRDRPNVAVLRTFSKAYGLAGLRVGYGLCGTEELRAAVDQVRQPFYLNIAAQAAAVEALKHQDEVERRVTQTIAARLEVQDGLRALGLWVAESDANFVWTRLPEDSLPEADVIHGLVQRGVLVRAGSALGREGALRVTIGTHEENQRFLTALGELL